MYIIPAIDLIDGRCVRLLQGRYDRRLDYQSDPVKQAEEFIADGARWLHIVDLEGAKTGKPVNTSSISAIAALGRLKIEAGGGLRNASSIQQLFDIGVERAIVGSRAVNDFAWLGRIAEKFPGRIVLGLDARGSKVVTQGWTQDSPQLLLELAVKAAGLPLAAIIYTDVTKDGMMTGPNIKRTKILVDAVKLPIIASGGVSSIDDIKKLADVSVAAAVIGRSLYEGTLMLSEAIKAAEQ
jgi:phosphoribosylformimino-5-aminoimidazole carboxamide ribotide isomerase